MRYFAVIPDSKTSGFPIISSFMSIKSAPSPPLVIQTEPTVTISRFESTDTVETVGRLTAKTGNDAAVTAKLTAMRDDTDLYAVVKIFCFTLAISLSSARDSGFKKYIIPSVAASDSHRLKEGLIYGLNTSNKISESPIEFRESASRLNKSAANTRPIIVPALTTGGFIPVSIAKKIMNTIDDAEEIRRDTRSFRIIIYKSEDHTLR